MVLRAPERWRLHAGWGRNMLADGLEQTANEALRRPACEADLAAAPADTEQLRRGLLVIGREHDAKRGKHDVKAGIGERQVLRVRQLERNGQALGLGALAASVE